MYKIILLLGALLLFTAGCNGSEEPTKTEQTRKTTEKGSKDDQPSDSGESSGNLLDEFKKKTRHFSYKVPKGGVHGEVIGLFEAICGTLDPKLKKGEIGGETILMDFVKDSNTGKIYCQPSLGKFDFTYSAVPEQNGLVLTLNPTSWASDKQLSVYHNGEYGATAYVLEAMRWYITNDFTKLKTVAFGRVEDLKYFKDVDFFNDTAIFDKIEKESLINKPKTTLTPIHLLVFDAYDI